MTVKDIHFFVQNNKKIDQLIDKLPEFTKNDSNIQECIKKMPNEKEKQNLQDLFSKIFVYIPSKRITAKKVLQHPFFSSIHK